MANPVKQIMAWGVQLLEQIVQNWAVVSQVIAIVLALSLAFVVFKRLTSDEDPSLRYQSSSAGGSMSILISGTHVTMLLAGGIALLTWPLALARPIVGLVLLGVVAAHFWIEKTETEMS